MAKSKKKKAKPSPQKTKKSEQADAKPQPKKQPAARPHTKVRAARIPKKKKTLWHFPLTKQNFIWAAIGFGVILLGFALMATGMTDEENIECKQFIENAYTPDFGDIPEKPLFVWDFGDGTILEKKSSKPVSYAYTKDFPGQMKKYVLTVRLYDISSGYNQSYKNLVGDALAKVTITKAFHKQKVKGENVEIQLHGVPVGKWNNIFAVNIAPLLLVFGYCVIIPFAIMKLYGRDKEEEES